MDNKIESKNFVKKMKKEIKSIRRCFFLAIVIGGCFLFLPFFRCEHWNDIICNESIFRYTFFCGRQGDFQGWTLGGVFLVFLGAIKGFINIKGLLRNKKIDEDGYLEHKKKCTLNIRFVIIGVSIALIYIFIEFFLYVSKGFNILNLLFWLILILVCVFFIFYIYAYKLGKKLENYVLLKNYYKGEEIDKNDLQKL